MNGHRLAGQESVLKLVEEETRLQRKALGDVRAGRMTVLKHEVQVLQRLDLALSEAVMEPVACKRGCSYCCHYHVYISATEAFAIADHVKNQLPGVRSGVIVKLTDNAAQAKSLGRDLHIQTNIACAFLSDHGDCLIYALRPIACRRHHALDVTPCRVTFENPLATDVITRSPSRVLVSDSFQMAALKATRLERLDSAMYEMNEAILEAINSGVALRRWRSGKNPFPSVVDREDLGEQLV